MEFLPVLWEDELHNWICSLHLKLKTDFPSWLNEICHINIVLWGTDYHFSDDALCLQLDSLLDGDLCTRCKNCKVKEAVENMTDSAGAKTEEAWLTCWVSEVQKLAWECSHNTKHYCKAAEELQCTFKRQVLGDPSWNYNTPIQKNAGGWLSSSSTRGNPPKLTENECALLLKHNGCLKCHQGYQDHHANNCLNSFPDGTNYKELMEFILLSHKQQATTMKNKGKTVRMVMSTSTATEMTDDKEDTVVRVVMLSAVLGSGSETEEEVNIPVTSCHYKWMCNILGNNADDPLTVNTLLNCSAHVILINLSVVDKLGRHHFCLFKPLPVSITLNGSSVKEKKTCGVCEVVSIFSRLCLDFVYNKSCYCSEPVYSATPW